MSSYEQSASTNGSDTWEGYANGCYEERKYVWATFSLLCFVIGFSASVSILWKMFRMFQRRIPLTPHNFFILNLSITDSVFLIFIPPGVFNQFIWKSSVLDSLWNSVYALSTCGRPFLMACVCLDCYVAVVHPIVYHQRKSLAPRVTIVAVVWTLTLATGTAYSFFPKLYLSFFPTISFLFAELIIVICDSFIIHSLVNSNPDRRKIQPQKKRAIQTVVYSLVMAVVAYSPPVLFFAIGRPLISSIETYICIIAVPITTTYTLGSAVMPLLLLYSFGNLGCSRLQICK